MVLILGIVVIGTTSVVALGSVALDGTERQSTLDRAEQSMAQFDSRAAQVALGEERSTRLSFGHSSGTYRVVDDAGTITITHVNHDGGSDADGNSVDDGPGDDDEDVYSGTLGAVVYENGDTEIAYQGGGVWRHRGDSTRMLSPPEFHYEGSTLTLPVVQVSGDESASGAPTAVVSKSGQTKGMYPNASTHYEDDSSKPTYSNPASDGQMIVTVESEYYRGWAEYFDSRTEGSVVDVDHANRTVTAELITLGKQGGFEIPTDNNPFEVRGLEPSMQSGEGLERLSFTVRPKDDHTNKFASLDWSLTAQNGDRRIEMNLGGLGNGKCGTGEHADLTVYYSDDGGATYQGWVAENAYEVTCDANGYAKIEVDLVGTGAPTAEYQSISGKLAAYNPGQGGGSLAGSTTFDHFDGDTGTTYSTGSTESVDVLVRHYLNHFAPTFHLESADGNNGNSVNEGESSGDDIQYTGDDVITYLHVSENGIEVRFE
ncbi:hypothetical protein GQS65_02460 [Halomarina oriensis]|uniref:DUF7308 domain-containing protein n=1 Tax=Halomarina oriensis TaxID=671145 RepID=A0A6B0GF89_9EURY|nr:hypothetical protein [Halomarina oriensis]MWG33364.1 hypothetical protein [Halomarina oriensis]